MKDHSKTQEKLDRLDRDGLIAYYMSVFNMTQDDANKRADNYLRAKQVRQIR